MLKKIIITAVISTLLFALDTPGIRALSCNITIRPGQSIQGAVDRAKSGDTVCVEYGNYNEEVRFIERSNITLIGLSSDKNQKPIIRGDKSTPKSNDEKCWRDSCSPPSGMPRCVPIAAEIGLLHIKQSNNLFIQNFEIKDSNGAGVIIANSKNVTVDNLDIHNSMHMGLKIKNGSENITVSNNKNHESNMFAPFPRSSGCFNWPQSFGANGNNGVVKNVLFLNNEVYNNWGEGIGIFDDVEDTRVIGNNIYNNHSTNLYTNNARKLVIANNFVHYDTSDKTFWRSGKNPSDCLSFGAESTKAGGAYDSDFHIYNNIFSNCSDLNQFTVSETQKELDRIVFENNIFHNPYTPGGSGTAFKLGSNTSQQVLFRNNLVIVDNNNILIGGGDASRAKFYNNIWSKKPADKFTSPTDIYLSAKNLNTSDIWLQKGNDDQVQYYLPTSKLSSLTSSIYPEEKQYTPVNYEPIKTDFFGCIRDNNPDIGAIEYGATNCNRGAVPTPTTPTPTEPTPTPTIEQPTPTPDTTDYDLNNDDKVDILDIIQIIKRVFAG